MFRAARVLLVGEDTSARDRIEPPIRERWLGFRKCYRKGAVVARQIHGVGRLLCRQFHAIDRNC